MKIWVTRCCSCFALASGFWLLANCAGTPQEREALRTLTPLPVSTPHPASGDTGLNEAARQWDALSKLEPIP